MRRGEAVTSHSHDQPDAQRGSAGPREHAAAASRLTALGARVVAIPAADALDDALAQRCARLGFNAVLLEGAVSPDALDARHVHALAARARRHGLRLLCEIDLHRCGAESPLARAQPALFRHETAATWPLDPRRELPVSGYLARFDRAGAAAGIVEAWIDALRTATAAGAAGFVVQWPQRVPVASMRRIVDATSAGGATFVADGAGLAAHERIALRDAGFAASLCSLPWWDYRAPWIVDELHDLQHVGPVLAPVDAAPSDDTQRSARLLRRALACARAGADGWLLRAGKDLAQVADAAAPDIEATNHDFAARTQRRHAEVLSAPWSRIGVWLQREEHGGVLHAINSDAEHHAALACAPFEAAAGIVVDTASVALAPAEVVAVRVASRPAATSAPAADALPRAIAAPRVAIEAITPTVDDGRFAAKATLGETVIVEADAFADGHPSLSVHLLWRSADEAGWNRVRMRALGNDRWRGEFVPHCLGLHLFTVEAGFDEFGALRSDIEKKAAAGQNVALDVAAAARLIADSAVHAPRALRDRLGELARELPAAEEPVARLLAADVAELMGQARAPAFAGDAGATFPVVVERRAARFGAWYELFPRSQGRAGEHGTFDDVVAQLPRVAAMGFDVLYFPPIHPIGTTNRKGANNALRAGAGEPGSTYAIGAAEGGHDALHPQLGTLDDFLRLVGAAREHGLEIALDFAIQCSPDHPWIRAHPEWFDWRPDGSLRFAENPPKKYEDIVNVDFYAQGAKPALWEALRDVVAFWLRHGVRIFRVDNPHTKPLPFWEWLIADLRARDPEVIFLSEAFTRPKPMYRLAKLGFSQSYTYFTWRNTRAEIEAYLTELTTAPVRDFFRPHFFVNTPDINPYFLQTAGRPGFLIRAALAATLSGLWGLYSGFELCEAAPLPGREEYVDSEKYQLRARDWNAPGNIVAEIAQLNRIRRDNPALHGHLGLTFYNSSNRSVVWFAKSTPTRDNVLLVAISLDPFAPQRSEVELPLWEWGLPDDALLCAEDLIGGSAFDWHGKLQTVALDPAQPYRIWRVRPERER